MYYKASGAPNLVEVEVCAIRKPKSVLVMRRATKGISIRDSKTKFEIMIEVSALLVFQ